MSEVLKWMALGEMAQRSRIGGGSYVQLADFDAEHALRLKAEKVQEMWFEQNGELRKANKAMSKKLDTAMGLLRRVGATTAMNYMVRQEWNVEFCDLADEFHTFLNTTSTECQHEWLDTRNLVVKSGEWCPKCGALRAGNTSTEGKDHE